VSAPLGLKEKVGSLGMSPVELGETVTPLQRMGASRPSSRRFVKISSGLRSG